MEWNGNDVINDYGMPTPRIDRKLCSFGGISNTQRTQTMRTKLANGHNLEHIIQYRNLYNMTEHNTHRMNFVMEIVCACLFIISMFQSLSAMHSLQFRMHNVQSKHVNNSINLCWCLFLSLSPPSLSLSPTRRVYERFKLCIVEIYSIVNRFRTSNAHLSMVIGCPLNCGIIIPVRFRSFSIEFSII